MHAIHGTARYTDTYWEQIEARELLARTKARGQKMRGPRTRHRLDAVRPRGASRRNAGRA